MTYVSRDKCRICQNTNLNLLMDLGLHSLGSIFPKLEDEDPPRAPLVLVKCHECGLVQLQHDVSASELYTSNYGYRSGLNATMIHHLKCLVSEIEGIVKLQADDIVLDIGCNDGTLLSCYTIPGLTKIGIDPCGLQFQKYHGNDLILVPDYFSKSAFVNKLGPHAKAKVVTSISMFYDLPDPMAFVKDVDAILAEDGI